VWRCNDCISEIKEKKRLFSLYFTRFALSLHKLKTKKMLVKTYCAAVNGLEVTTVTCEVSMSRGVQFHLTGLADTAVKESHDRIKAALVNNGFKMPVMEIT
jgi:hypothetical protein